MQLTGLTPVIDGLLADIGLYPAYLYGYIWRKCQSNPRSECNEGIDTIVAETGLSRTTVIKHLQLLAHNGYIIDLTPDLRNKPHTYSLSGKISINANFAMSHSLNLNCEPVDNSQSTVRDANPHSTRREPSQYATRTPGGAPNEPQTPYIHDIHDDDVIQSISGLWSSLGLDAPALGSMLKRWSGREPDLAALLAEWVNNIDSIPEGWGGGAVYNAIKRGELPPAPEVNETQAEFEAIMEYQRQNRLGLWARQPGNADDVADRLEMSPDAGVRAVGREFRRHAAKTGL